MHTRAPRAFLAGVLAAAFVLGSGISLLVGPATPRLGETSVGDPQLAADVRAALTTDRGYLGLAAARVRYGEVTYAGLGEVDGGVPTPETPFELGSITKTFTGSLLADGVRRGELALDEPVATYLDELRGSAVGDATLRQLATHTAGLPPFPDAMTPGVLLRVVGNENVSDTRTVAGLLSAAHDTEVEDRGTYRYSNLGVALLGHAEARAAGMTDWPTLLRARILDPLGMTATTIAERRSDVTAGAAEPHHDNGWPAAYWYGPALAPAGAATWTTTTDLARWARALLDGTAPGATALDPVAEIPGGSIGLTWHLLRTNDRDITWHNGGTGGFRTILALDRERGQAVMILSNTTRDADRAGRLLAANAPGEPVRAVDRPEPSWASVAGWSTLGVLLLGTGVRRLRTPRRWWAVLDGSLALGVGLLVLLVHGPWLLVPAWIWGGLVAVSLVLAVRGARLARRRDVPQDPSAPRRRTLALSLASSALALAFVVWTT